MKNIFFNWNKTVRNKVLLFSFFLFISQITNAQDNPTLFTVTGTNGTCLSNASIKVRVPTGNYKLGWKAHVWKTGYTSEQVVPIIGGDIVFNSLAPGIYNVELTDDSTPLPTQTVTLTTTYTDFTLGYSYITPSATCPGATDGQLTVRVASGGAGPFKYDVSYPTPAPGTGTTNQTYTGPERNRTFLNIPGGITVNYTVTDLVGGATGCENSKTQTPTLGSTSVSSVDFYGYSPFNFVRTSSTKCNNPTLYVNLVNIDAARDAYISADPNRAIVEIKNASGSLIATRPLTKINSIRYKYDAAVVGGPELENNWTVTVKINWGCSILQRTSTVVVGNNWVDHNIKYAINTSCTVDYIWYLLGENQTGGNRNMYFLNENKLEFEKLNPLTNIWEPVPSTDVTPNPADMINPLGVTGAHTATLPSANGQFIFKNPGTYRYIASDACHTLPSKVFVFVPKTNPINEVTVVQSKSVLQGTSSIRVAIGTPLKPDFKIEISRADLKTSILFTATGPLNMAGSYTATFPQVRTITSATSVGGYFDFADLPLGDYIVKLSDGCGSTRTVNITLNQPAEYTPVFTPVLSCTGSNKIVYNLGHNANAYVVGAATLYTDNGSGAPGAYQANLSGTSGTFINLNAGNYVVAFNGVGAGLSSVSGVTYLKSYYQKVQIVPYGGIEIETSSVMCDPTNTNSGIVNVELVNNDILTPTTIKLFSASDMTTPIRNITLAAGATGTVFTNIAVGNYVVRVANECTSTDKNISITTGSTGTAPIAKVNRPKVCNSDKTIKLAITASNSLYDVVWTDSSNTVVGNVTPLTLTNPSTTRYTAKFKLKSGFGCANVEEYISSVDVVVTADPDLSSAVAVSDIDLCLNNSRDFTISNTQVGFKYELTDKDGISYATPIYSAESTGGTITMTIPAGITLVAGNTFKIKAISGGCSGFLNDVVSITSKQNNLNLDVITPTAMICSGIDSTLTIKNTESGVTYTVKKNGVTIPSGTVTGTGSDMVFTIRAAQLTAGTNEFIVSTSGTGCQNGDLTQRGIINVNTAPVISGALTTIELFGCDSITVPAPYTTVAQLEAKGVTISDDATTDANLIITSTDAVNPGSAIKKFFTRTYKITDACGVFKTVNQTIILNITTPTAPTITTTTATTFCIGGSVVLTSSATTGNQWYKDAVAISGATAQTHTATVAGTYTVVTTNGYNCPSPASAGVAVVVNVLPVATINNGIALAFVDCTATTIDLTASGGSAFVWYFSPDNTTPFSVLPATTQTIQATNLGFYKVKVINSTNCEAESQVTQVVAKPAVSATELETCVGNTITLRSNTSSFDTPTFQWKKNGNNIAGATTQNWDVTEDGVYTVEVTDGRPIGSGNIGTQTSCGANVHFNPLPVVEAGTNFTITCTTNPTGLTIGETPEAGFRYEWTPSLGLTDATIANPVATPTVNTTYTVRKTNLLTLCWKEDTITITVDKTAPTANAGTPFTKTCVTNTLGKEIGIAPIAGLTYSWSPATGLDNAFIANPNANPETTQTYTLTVENTTNGCTAQATVLVTVDLSTPTANAGTAFTKTCATNSTGQLIGATAESGVTYSWYPTTGLSDATISNPNANPTATTTYTITARKTATGCTSQASVLVSVDLSTPTADAGTAFTKTCATNTTGQLIGATAE
ncbi:MAG: hypothetical protein RIT22_166, partial [Bacteroidota bacterium]